MNLLTTLPTVAFLGIGLMGKPMTIRLLQTGYPVIAWNRTHAKAEALMPLGAQVANQPSNAVRNADIVITMLEAGPIVAEVIESALPGLKDGALVIDMSSTRQSEAQDLHAKLLAKGIAFIDAPVSGSVLGAETGTLAIMAGGSVENFARAEPVLRTMGRPAWLGPSSQTVQSVDRRRYAGDDPC